MEEREHLSVESPEGTQAGAGRVTRRHALKLLATAGGALATLAVLPAGAAQAEDTEECWMNTGSKNPVINHLATHDCHAGFMYYDRQRAIDDATTLMGISTSEDGEFDFKTLSDWSSQIGLMRCGTHKLGGIHFQMNGLGFCGLNGPNQICVQLQVAVPNSTARFSNKICAPIKQHQ